MKKRKSKEMQVNESIVITALAVLVVLYAFNTAMYGFALKTLQGPEAPVAPKLEAIHLVSSDCTNCYETRKFVAGLTAAGVEFTKERTVEYSSTEGKTLIQLYDIQNVPALILKGETTKNPGLTTQLLRLGERKGDNFVLQSTPPYVELATGKLVGSVSVTYLNDSLCTACYDVTNHREVLSTLGIYVEKESFIDVSSTEGRALVTRYGITAVPTILLGGDMKYYKELAKVWPDVGTEETDGTFIFRNTAIMQEWGGYNTTA